MTSHVLDNSIIQNFLCCWQENYYRH